MNQLDKKRKLAKKMKDKFEKNIEKIDKELKKKSKD